MTQEIEVRILDKKNKEDIKKALEAGISLEYKINTDRTRLIALQGNTIIGYAYVDLAFDAHLPYTIDIKVSNEIKDVDEILNTYKRIAPLLIELAEKIVVEKDCPLLLAIEYYVSDIKEQPIFTNGLIQKIFNDAGYQLEPSKELPETLYMVKDLKSQECQP